MITGIEHSAIASADMPALAAWYRSVLGFDIVYQSENAAFVRAPNGAMIEIIRAEGPRPESGLKTPGHRHLAIAVTGFDAELDALRAKNVRLLAEPDTRGANKIVFFADPEGNVLHLIERGKPLC